MSRSNAAVGPTRRQGSNPPAAPTGAGGSPRRRGRGPRSLELLREVSGARGMRPSEPSSRRARGARVLASFATPPPSPSAGTSRRASSPHGRRRSGRGTSTAARRRAAEAWQVERRRTGRPRRGGPRGPTRGSASIGRSRSSCTSGTLYTRGRDRRVYDKFSLNIIAIKNKNEGATVHDY